MKIQNKDGTQTNLLSLIITLLMAINAGLMSFDVYHLTNEQMDAVVHIVSIVGSIVGVAMNHRKPTK